MSERNSTVHPILKALAIAPLGAPLAALLLAVLIVSAACQPSDPMEQVSKVRGKYEATVNTGGFVAQPNYPEPIIDLDAEGEEGDETASADDGEGGEGEEEMAPPEPESYDIVLDLIVSHRARSPLPQLTVDVIHVDPQGTEKGHYYAVLDTSKVPRGPGAQISHRLEGVDYQEGDAFTVEVVHSVAPADRGNYPEFAAAGNG